MLTLNKLEKIMEMEAKLRDEYQEQLEGKDKEIAKLTDEKEALAGRVEELQGTINTQLETISSLSGKASDTKAMENRNRELHNRSENMKEEVATVKARLKALQKENQRLRKIIADQRIDMEILKEAIDVSAKNL